MTALSPEPTATTDISVGNAAHEGNDGTGWFVGPFVAKHAGPRHTKGVRGEVGRASGGRATQPF